MSNGGPVSDDGPATVRDLLDLGTRKLPTRPGIPDPAREARWLLAAASGRTEAWLRIHPSATVAAAAAQRYKSWLQRRRAGEPAEHLVGSCPFWGRTFLVSRDVLIPRPETELLIQAALQLELPANSRVLDVGGGSGCLGVTLAAERSTWRVAAVDRSAAALAIARRNAAAHGVLIEWFLGDLTTAVAPGFDLVVANLPYLPTAWLEALPVEVSLEPTTALDGGADGLDLVRRLLADLSRVLAPGGICLFELAEDQAPTVRESALGLGLQDRGTWRDVGGCERVVAVQRPCAETQKAQV